MRLWDYIKYIAKCRNEKYSNDFITKKETYYSDSIARMNLISLFCDVIKIVYYLFKWICFLQNLYQEEIGKICLTVNF